MVHFNYTDWTLVEFYSYTTCVMDRIVETEHSCSSDNFDRVSRSIKKFFDACIADAKTVDANQHWDDNKVVFKVRHNRTGKTIFVGFYDGSYSIGLSAKQSFGYRYNFETGVVSDYYLEDYSRELIS